jgi:ribonuclease HII
LLEYEQQLWARGCSRIAGVDEVGRGPLAGPVLAAAVVLPRAFAERELNGLLRGMTDSKQVSASARERFFSDLMKADDADIGVGYAEVSEIDAVNILQATYLAMRRALADLVTIPDHILVDGLPVPGLPAPSTAIVKGDTLSLSIAAASIIAKVVRDRYMCVLDRVYPGYGFASHKGYGSQRHIQALLEHGPVPIHRRSFSPVREADVIRRRMRKADSGTEMMQP